MNNKPILLVEDNPNDIEFAKRAFAREGIANEIIVAEDGRQALDHLLDPGRDCKGLPGLVLLDLKMPGVDGLEVLRQMRQNEKTRRIPVIILTSSNEDNDLRQAYDLGANSYIRKPIDFAVFQNTVKVLSAYWLEINEQPPC